MFQTLAAALMVVVFLVPGFVWRTVENQLVYLDKRLNWERFALGLLARSTVVYLPWAGLLYRGWKAQWLDKYPFAIALAAFGLLIVMPALLGLMVGALRQRGVGSRIIKSIKLRAFEQHQIPTAWDYLFSRLKASWVTVTLKDGNKIHGYAGPTSYFSSDPDERDLFISRVVRLDADGGFEFVRNSAGAYIRGDQIVAIEFVCPPTADNATERSRTWQWKSVVVTNLRRLVRVMISAATSRSRKDTNRKRRHLNRPKSRI